MRDDSVVDQSDAVKMVIAEITEYREPRAEGGTFPASARSALRPLLESQE